MSEKMIEIRPATAKDAGDVAVIHVSSWKAAYQGIIPDDFLAQLSVERRKEYWFSAISDDAVDVIVAEVDSKIIGWAAFASDRDSSNARTVEIQAIYVEPDFWRRGVGSRLIMRVLELSYTKEYSNLCLWVLALNVRALHFYHNFGFAKVDEKIIHRGGIELLEYKMKRPTSVIATSEKLLPA